MRSSTSTILATAASASGTVVEAQTTVTPWVETVAVSSSGDAADDAAFWLHPTDSALSLVIGTDKAGSGLQVYDLDGLLLQVVGPGEPNNTDVRYNFPLGGGLVDLVGAGNRTDDTIRIYRVDVPTRTLVEVAVPPPAIGVAEAMGFCFYRSRSSGATYAFINDDDGNVEQWELFDAGGGLVGGRVVRSFAVGGQTEGMVADDELGWLYVSEEEEGIWRYGAEPDAGTLRTLVDSSAGGGQLTADVEGLAVYYASNGGGYLLASSQGSDEFVVYERTGSNAHLLTFQIGKGGGIDAVTGTDGIDVASFPLGSRFSQGAFIAQDDVNPGTNQNFKLVPWESIAASTTPPLKIDTTWDPRDFAPPAVPGDLDGDGVVGISDLLILLNDWGPCPAPPEECPADLSGDGSVGITDLLILLLNWDTSPPALPGDFDGDGVVGISDLLILLKAWGPCPAPPEECPADVTGDGSVGFADLLVVLANWG